MAAVVAVLRTASVIARARGTLFPVGRLVKKYAVAQAEFTGLLVYLKKFHGDFVAFLDAGFLYCLQVFPCNLADMQKTFLARHELYKTAVRHNAHYFGIVC